MSSATTAGTWTVTRTFGLQGNLLTETYTGAHPLSGRTVTLTYDNLLRRDSFGLNLSPTPLAYTFGYDGASRLLSVGDGAYSATYGYLANSPLVGSVTLRQGTSARLVTTRSFDYLNRLLDVTSQPQATGAFPIGTAYQYNAADQRTRQLLGGGDAWIYGYDGLGQLTSGKRYFGDGTPVPGQQFEYSYDTIGNRTSAKHGGDANGVTLRSESYNANNLNQYSSRPIGGGRYADILGLAAAASSVSVNGVTAWRKGEYFRRELNIGEGGPVWQNVDVTTAGGGSVTGGKLYVAPIPESFGYDTDGNLTSDGRWSYTWDAENRLVRQETVAAAYNAGVPRQQIQYDYDDQGRRLRKRVSNWNTVSASFVVASDVRYVLDGWNVVAELNGLASGSLLRNYLWGGDLSGTLDGAGGVGGLIYMKPSGGNAQFTAYDGNGNVIGLVDGASSATTANYEYSPFGETLRITGAQASSNPFRFSTKHTESESGIIYYGYRFYNPLTGRWINRDPSDENRSDSLYSFVGNHSIDSIDSHGLYETDFHFYAVYFIGRAKGLKSGEASSLAYWSQHVDNDDYTNPIRLGARVKAGLHWAALALARSHFPGSSQNAATFQGHPDAIERVERYKYSSPNDLVWLGDALHTLADTYSHDGFSAFDSRRINDRGNNRWFPPSWMEEDEKFGCRTGSYVGHANAGHRPDYPFLNPAKALRAAK